MEFRCSAAETRGSPYHEVGDDPVEGGPLEVQGLARGTLALLSCINFSSPLKTGQNMDSIG